MKPYILCKILSISYDTSLVRLMIVICQKVFIGTLQTKKEEEGGGREIQLGGQLVMTR